MDVENSMSENYGVLLQDLKDRVYAAQYNALKSVNKELIKLYWQIGRTITAQVDNGGWGKSIVEKLASDLQSEFPGIRGFSAQNLWRMAEMYKAYSNNANLSSLMREIG